MIDHAFTGGPDPVCSGCTNRHVRFISIRAFSRKVARLPDRDDGQRLLDFAMRPHALTWTCDRCGEFGVSDFVDEYDSFLRHSA